MDAPFQRTRFRPQLVRGFATTPPPLKNLSDLLTQLEQNTATVLTSNADELKSEVGRPASRLTEVDNKSDRLLNTDIGALSDDLAALTRYFFRVEHGLSKIKHSLVDQAETFFQLNHPQDTILTLLDGFTTAYTQADKRLNRL